VTTPAEHRPFHSIPFHSISCYFGRTVSLAVGGGRAIAMRSTGTPAATEMSQSRYSFAPNAPARRGTRGSGDAVDGRMRPAACGMARTRGPLRERDHDGGRQDREARGEPRLQRIRPRAAERGRRGCDDITQRPAVALLRAKGKGQPSRAHGYSVVSREASARLSERIRRTHR
jgi:hypothetical protein